MDLFNRKEINRLKLENASLRIELIGLKDDRKEIKDTINKMQKDNQLERENFEKITTQLLEENQKLIKWIETILDTFGTVEVKERNQIQIPVYIDKSIRAYDINYMGIFERERITIPEITIIKMG